MKLKFIQIKTLQHHKNHNHIAGRNCLKLRHIFLMKLKFVNKMPKKIMKWFNTITDIVDTTLITLTVITGVISIAAFASCVVVPVGIVLSGTSPLPSLVTAITRKSFKIFTVKQEKHDAIKLLAQGKLDIIPNIISQAMQCSDFSPIEFHRVLQEVEKYRKLKADIRNQAEAKEITKEQREEILEQGIKEGKDDFLGKIADSSRTQGANAIWNMRYPRFLRHVILWPIKATKIGLKFCHSKL